MRKRIAGRMWMSGVLGVLGRVGLLGAVGVLGAVGLLGVVGEPGAAASSEAARAAPAAIAQGAETDHVIFSINVQDFAYPERSAQLAFYINAYNAYTIQLILAHDETRSIRNINKTGGIIKGYGPWTEKLAVVGGTAYGLDHIEQKIIRPTYQEPRIHFALVCAAMGCPPQ